MMRRAELIRVEDEMHLAPMPPPPTPPLSHRQGMLWGLSLSTSSAKKITPRVYFWGPPLKVPNEGYS